MRDEFYRIYSQLLEAYDVVPVSPSRRWDPLVRLLPPVELIAKLVDVAAQQAGVTHRLRPDARYFLVINLYQMVVMPVTHPAAARSVPADLLDDLLADATTVLREAAPESDVEVTGHAVVDSLSRSWGKLRVTAANIWG